MASDAQIAANRRNALLSTGPKTADGKAQSRKNALKHGLTGEGVALPDEDAAEVASRFEILNGELQPSGLSSRILLHRFAYLSVRLERCERLDTAVYSKRVRHATDDFDDHRMALVEELAAKLDHEPMTASRRLKAMPEGVAYLLEEWTEIRNDLLNRDRVAWTTNHRFRIERLLGRSSMRPSTTRLAGLSEALFGAFHLLAPAEIDGLTDSERIEWARTELTKIVDAEIARLEELRESLSTEAIDQDRVEAPTRSLFDLQPAMQQVRKYEAATERNMYKALKEFHALEATLKAARLAAESAIETTELASFEPESDEPEALVDIATRQYPPAAEIPPSIHLPTKWSLETRPGPLMKPGESLT